jgi:hypothetical protein
MFLLTACAQFPALDATLDEAAYAAPYPQLQSIEPLLAQSAAMGTTGRNSPATLAGAEGRIASLRASAAGLRGPIIDPATRARMARGVDTTALQ